MALIADILLIAGALGAAFYCMVLSRRLRRFADLEKGVGGAVAVLSVQVDDMNRTIRQAEKAAVESAARLNELTARSEDAARRLELMLASMHDLPIDPAPAEAPSVETWSEAPKQDHDTPATDAPVSRQKERKEPPIAAPKAEAPAASMFSSRRKLGEKAA